MLRTLPAWQALAEHAQSLRPTHLRELFAGNPARFDHFSLRHGKLLLDFSKQRVTEETLARLRQLAQELRLDAWTARLRAGEAINHTEGRAVRHMDLRAGDSAPPEVKAVLSRMAAFCDAIHSGTWRG